MQLFDKKALLLGSIFGTFLSAYFWCRSLHSSLAVAPVLVPSLATKTGVNEFQK
jgi:hypothetical protein